MTETKHKGRPPIEPALRRQIYTCCCSSESSNQLARWLETEQLRNAKARRGNIIDRLVDHALKTGFTI